MVTEDIVNFITRYEDGACDEGEIRTGFQLLINSGIAWQLQGSYGRTATALIEQGECTPPQSNNARCPGGQCGL